MTSHEDVPQVKSVLGRDLRVGAINGPDGRFWIAFEGMRREDGTDYFYEDERARFWFLADCDFGQTPLRWEVKNATQRFRGGGFFKSSPQNEAIFRRNIEFFVKTRYWMEPWKRGDGSTAEVSVSFSWSVAP